MNPQVGKSAYRSVGKQHYNANARADYKIFRSSRWELFIIQFRSCIGMEKKSLYSLLAILNPTLLDSFWIRKGTQRYFVIHSLSQNFESEWNICVLLYIKIYNDNTVQSAYCNILTLYCNKLMYNKWPFAKAQFTSRRNGMEAAFCNKIVQSMT